MLLFFSFKTFDSFWLDSLFHSSSLPPKKRAFSEVCCAACFALANIVSKVMHVRLFRKKTKQKQKNKYIIPSDMRLINACSYSALKIKPVGWSK